MVNQDTNNYQDTEVSETVVQDGKVALEKAPSDAAPDQEKTFKMKDIQEIINSLKDKFEQEINALKDYTDNTNKNIQDM